MATFYSTCKDVSKLVKRYVGYGWIFQHGRKHGKLINSQGKGFVIIPTTPSDTRRCLNNIQRDIRKIEKRV